MELPEGYQTVIPYLILRHASEFLSFTKKVFDAEETHNIMREGDIIRHGEVVIGTSTIMFADANENYKSQPANLFIYVENADDTYKKAIDAGATPVTELSDQTYGRSGGVKDPAGNTWWITSVK